jgi:hypothetical protein
LDKRAKQSRLRLGRFLPERHADVEFSWKHAIRDAAGRNRAVAVIDLPPVAAGKAILSRDAADFALAKRWNVALATVTARLLMLRSRKAQKAR